MWNWVKGSWVVVLAFVLGVAVAGAGTATAARLITGKQIKNGSITYKDLSPGVKEKLNQTGPNGTPGPKGEPGPSGPGGPAGPAGLSLLTFADSSVSGGLTLSGADAVVTTTAQQLPNANGSVGGPLVFPAGPGRYAQTSTVRVRTQGSGNYVCALQVAVNGSQFFDLDRTELASPITLRFTVPSGAFLNNTVSQQQYRVVCNGAATRSVIDADLSVIAALKGS